MKTRAYAAWAATTALESFEISRREPGALDVAIDILFCGVCHSDLHQVRGEWNNSQFPMVPGHEIIGRVARVGDQVTTVAAGDLVGVGCIVDSCRTCGPYQRDHEQFCAAGSVPRSARQRNRSKLCGMGCVVCGGPIAEPHFANAWERVRKLYPCCKPACAARFDPDVHWLPAEKPLPVTPDDEHRLMRAAAERLRAGDRPSLVVRDLLVAGIAPTAVRKLVIGAELSVAAKDRWVNRFNVLGVIGALFGGRWHVADRNDRRDPEQLRAAAIELETWSARFT